MAPFRLGACAQAWCPSTKMDVVQTHQCPELNLFIKQLGKDIDYPEIGHKFGVGASTACKKVNTAGTHENLFRLVPVPGHGARVLPLVNKLVLRHQQKALFRLVPMPWQAPPSLNGAYHNNHTKEHGISYKT